MRASINIIPLLLAVGISVVMFLFLGSYRAEGALMVSPSLTIKRGEQAKIAWYQVGGSNQCVPTTDYPATADGVRSYWTGGNKVGDGESAPMPFYAAGTYTFDCADTVDSSAIGRVQIIVNDCPAYGETWNGSNACVAASPTFTLTVNAPTGGTITGAGISCPGDCSETVTSGTNITLTANPSGGYSFAGWGGGSCSGLAPCTVTMNQPRTVTASFSATPPITFTINASAGAGGTISPSGSVSVVSGNNQTFTITPGGGNVISTVLVDGVNNPGAVSSGSYTFTNVTSGHTISATYTAAPPINYSINVTAPANGNITGAGGVNCGVSCATSVSAGTGYNFTVNPNSGYTVSGIFVNGSNVGTGPAYTIPSVNGNTSISATIIAAPLSPNLVVQSLSVPGTGTNGTSMNLSATVRNSGGAPAGPFSNDFTYQWNGTGGAWTSVPGGVKAYGSGLGAGATGNDSVTFTPGQTGTLYIQYCVDSYNQVAEGANESPNCSVSGGIAVGAASLNCLPANVGPGNNCQISSLGNPGNSVSGTCINGTVGSCSYTCDGSTGSWSTPSSNSCSSPANITTFEVCTTVAPIVCGNNVTPLPPVPINTPLVINWDADPGSATCVRQSGPGDFSTGNTNNGSDGINASSVYGDSKTYTLQCVNGGPLTVDTQSLTVTTMFADPVVTVEKAGVPVSTVQIGDPVTVKWDSNNTNETLCSLTGGGLNYPSLPGGNGDNEVGWVAPVIIQGRTTFTVNCGGSYIGTRTVEVVPQGWES